MFFFFCHQSRRRCWWWSPVWLRKCQYRQVCVSVCARVYESVWLVVRACACNVPLQVNCVVCMCVMGAERSGSRWVRCFVRACVRVCVCVCVRERPHLRMCLCVRSIKHKTAQTKWVAGSNHTLNSWARTTSTAHTPTHTHTHTHTHTERERHTLSLFST